MYYRKTSPFICQEGHSRTAFTDSCPVVWWRLLKSPLLGHGWVTVGSLGRKRGLELGLEDLASRKTGCPYVSYILSGKHYWNSSWTPRWAKDWKRKKRSGMVGSLQVSRFAGSLLFSVLEVSPQDLGLTLSLHPQTSTQIWGFGHLKTLPLPFHHLCPFGPSLLIADPWDASLDQTLWCSPLTHLFQCCGKSFPNIDLFQPTPLLKTLQKVPISHRVKPDLLRCCCPTLHPQDRLFLPPLHSS